MARRQDSRYSSSRALTKRGASSNGERSRRSRMPPRILARAGTALATRSAMSTYWPRRPRRGRRGSRWRVWSHPSAQNRSRRRESPQAAPSTGSRRSWPRGVGKGSSAMSTSPNMRQYCPRASAAACVCARDRCPASPARHGSGRRSPHRAWPSAAGASRAASAAVRPTDAAPGHSAWRRG